MREIKFRAWDKVDRKMVDVDNMDFASEYINLEMRTNNYVVEQYTGLKDKNGKEIYEGDIVTSLDAFLGRSSYRILWDEKRAHWSAIAVGGYVQADWQCPLSWLSLSGLPMKVIGNIHENPELIP